MKSKPITAGLDLEWAALAETGRQPIVGVDEAGRGALAGPVVAAAVALPLAAPEKLAALQGVHDSKQLTARQRAQWSIRIREHALCFGIGLATAAEIDQEGILPATRLAMRRALDQLDPAACFLLIDGRIRLGDLPTPQRPIIRGDSQSLSIAAASILAKVTRDQSLVELGRQFPQYGFARHKGYATAAHLQALASQGPCPEHRHSFAPIRRPLVE